MPSLLILRFSSFSIVWHTQANINSQFSKTLRILVQQAWESLISLARIENRYQCDRFRRWLYFYFCKINMQYVIPLM
ncbi:hypothetical protein Mal48_33360 [Thalassoglobus polymorphus]|uniref:Uncharacterized protein n=1 Tax=Thalassoglobus polymorphus TaxID=2527994 RepID=A0A517QR18_9PLAN|nr:hypothetical protein Mal48_33360 [Thalassoglobus polymorphus]